MQKSRIFDLFTVNALILHGQSLQTQLDEYIQSGDYDSLQSLLMETADSQDFEEIEQFILDQAKADIVNSRYDSAQKLLEALLLVNLDNTEAQDIYVAATELLAGTLTVEDPGQEAAAPPTELASAETASQLAAPVQPAEVVAQTQETDITAQSTQGVEQGEQEQTLSPPEVALVADPENTAGENQTPSENPVSTATTPAVKVLPDILPSQPEVPKPQILSFRVFFGAVDVMMYYSQFYADFYGESRFNFTYGISSDLSFLLNFPRIQFGTEINIDGHFADLGATSGDQLYYKILLTGAFPTLFRIPLFLRLGYASSNFTYDESDIDVLYTNLFGPVFGVKLDSLMLGELVSVSATIDYHAISFFTSFLDAAFESAIGVTFHLPSRGAFGVLLHAEIMPTMLVGLGSFETNIKLKIGAGVSYHDR